MTLISPYTDKAATTDYGPGRICTRGKDCETRRQIGDVGKVHRYTEPHQVDEDGIPTILFCEPCERERARQDVEPHELQGSKKKGRMTAYRLPNLRDYREACNLTRAELAELADCGFEHIRRIERDEVAAGVKVAHRLARALDVDVRALRGCW
jgi:DNA-binding XRE family transcriptional regulator